MDDNLFGFPSKFRNGQIVTARSGGERIRSVCDRFSVKFGALATALSCNGGNVFIETPDFTAWFRESDWEAK